MNTKIYLDSTRKSHIARIAADLRKPIVAREMKLRPQVEYPFEVLDPRIPLKDIGIICEEHPDLSPLLPPGHALKSDLLNIIGWMDREHGIAAVCDKLSPEAKNFTLAHELGHWLLHEYLNMHRERLVPEAEKPLEELEADKFATYYLMPRKWVIKIFMRIFGSNPPLKINEELAFLLAPQDQEAILHPNEKQKWNLVRESAVADYSGFGSSLVPFLSMSEQFKVSNQAMAIRIKELGLVETV